MNTAFESSNQRLLGLLQAVRDTQDENARATLNDVLRKDRAARVAMARLLVDEQALIHRLRDDGIVSLLATDASVALPKISSSRSWLPLSAAASGIVFGMFFTSLVFGYVAQRTGAVRKEPLEIYDPGFEDNKQVLDNGLPRAARRWGVDSGALTTAENDVLPLEGSHMLRLEPIPREKNVKNHTSRVYQVVDLSSLPSIATSVDLEVKVTASFCTTRTESSSRYLIRAIALIEAPEQAMKDFWSKTENDDVVSMSERFDTLPGDKQWHKSSLKMPIPRETKTLVLILGALPPQNEFENAGVNYLDDVQVSLLTSQSMQP